MIVAEHNNSFRLSKEGCQRDHETGIPDTLAKQYGEFSGITRQDNKESEVPGWYTVSWFDT